MNMKRGEIWLVNLDPTLGAEIRKTRPVVVVNEITTRKRLSNSLAEVIKYLNRVIRGWRNYFRIGNSTRKLQQLDRYVRKRLRQWVRSQQGSRGPWEERVFEGLLAQSGLEYFNRSGICGANP